MEPESPCDRGRWTANVIRRNLLLYAVTDRARLKGRSLVSCVEDAVAGGASFVQLREKCAPAAEVEALARQLKDACRRLEVPFVIDDDVALAQKVGADGVHVGQSDTSCARARELLGNDAIVGVSAQTVEEAVRAWHEGADYLGVGALHPTPTKPDAVDVTYPKLRRICDAVPIPVVGIGGIDCSTAHELAGTGVAGAAVVSAIFAAPDCRVAASELRERLTSVVTNGMDCRA